jgi:hypothetical protein
VGIALYVVLETLTPAERLAFVLHDMFDVRSERDDEIRVALDGLLRPRRGRGSRGHRRVFHACVPFVVASFWTSSTITDAPRDVPRDSDKGESCRYTRLRSGASPLAQSSWFLLRWLPVAAALVEAG